MCTVKLLNIFLSKIIEMQQLVLIVIGGLNNAHNMLKGNH